MNDVNLNPETQTDVSKLEVLISRQQLQERIRELGQTISEDYKNKELDLVGVLKGGFIFLADLVRELKIPCRIHFLQ
ncbi:MAG: phosphoribosyltransferase family protein, partial [SAR324 cluster bacterium]|nr:phosphoribosyltransferase family protein [SAR324 cluster bacterium]